MIKSFRLVSAPLALLFLLSACGGSGSSDSSTASTSSTTASSTSDATTTPTTTSASTAPKVTSSTDSSSSTTTGTGQVAFAASSYSVSQTAGAVTLSVTRSGGAQGAASVTYATTFGTALDGINYGNTNGVLTWAAGDASAKTISVPILQTAAFSGVKVLSMGLSGASGAALGTPANASISIVGSTNSSAAAVTKSISSWVSCTGTTDDQAGVAQALAAARDGAFTLVVDCPVMIHVGADIARTLFIDNGTTVQFTGAGKFIVDNTFIPAFAIADSSNITLSGWIVEYNATLGVNLNGVPAYQNGQLINNGQTKPGNAFNDIALTNWLSTNRGITFQNVKSNWSGSTNMCAVFLIAGDSTNISVSNMQVSVPTTAGVQSYVPVVFALAQDFKAQQTVNASTPMTNQYVALPSNLTFSNVTFDGIYMGWVGNAREVSFGNIQSKRYGDLEDASGNNVGGVDKWFAPPHLFYLSYSSSTDALLVNSNITISNVVDSGPRLGTARDKGGSDTMSGYALSLKIACNTCTVDNYTSARPDGLLDVLASNGLSISNVTATYDSAFLNNIYPGWRFPSSPYENLSFSNISITDTAAQSVQPPIGNAGMSTNQNIVMSNVSAVINAWAGSGSSPLPVIAGSNLQLSLDYLVTQSSLRIVRTQTDALQGTLQVSPATLSAAGTAQLTWTSEGAASCAATGAWSGALTPSGSKSVQLTAAGTYDFDLGCSSAQDATTPASAAVVVN